MKVFCRFTGIEFPVAGFKLSTHSLIGQHPLIDAPVKKLVELYEHFHLSKLSPAESRILFCALLKKTDHIIFDHPATPTLSTIYRTIDRLIVAIDWIHEEHTEFKLPKYRITSLNSDIRSVGNWIDSWYDARQTWLDTRGRTEQRTKFLYLREQRLAALQRLIKNAYRNVEDYAGRLGTWAMDATEITSPELRDYWIKLFRLKEPELYNANPNELQELLQHLLDHLDVAGSQVAQTAVRHINSILIRNQQGILYGLEMWGEEEAAEILSKESRPYTILSGKRVDIAKNMRAEIISKNPVTSREPQVIDFAKKIDFLLAHARWKLQQDAAKDAEEQEQKFAAQLAAEETSKPLEVASSGTLDPEFDNQEERQDDNYNIEALLADTELFSSSLPPASTSTSTSTKADEKDTFDV